MDNPGNLTSWLKKRVQVKGKNVEWFIRKKVIPYKKNLLDLFGNVKNQSVLDYGCGRGDFVELLLERKDPPKKIWAVVSSLDMINKIQQDFDSAIYHSDMKELTRDLVHHFSDTQQPWQKYADGQMGRKIPGLIAHSKFANQASCDTWRLVERNFTPGTYGFLMAQMVTEIGKGVFDDTAMNKWLSDLREKDTSEDYYFAIDLVVGKMTQPIINNDG